MYLCPSYTLPLPGTMHLTLKMEAARSSRSWYPVATLDGITTQKAST